MNSTANMSGWPVFDLWIWMFIMSISPLSFCWICLFLLICLHHIFCLLECILTAVHIFSLWIHGAKCAKTPLEKLLLSVGRNLGLHCIVLDMLTPSERYSSVRDLLALYFSIIGESGMPHTRLCSVGNTINRQWSLSYETLSFKLSCKLWESSTDQTHASS